MIIWIFLKKIPQFYPLLRSPLQGRVPVSPSVLPEIMLGKVNMWEYFLGGPWSWRHVPFPRWNLHTCEREGDLKLKRKLKEQRARQERKKKQNKKQIWDPNNCEGVIWGYVENTLNWHPEMVS